MCAFAQKARPNSGIRIGQNVTAAGHRVVRLRGDGADFSVFATAAVARIAATASVAIKIFMKSSFAFEDQHRDSIGGPGSLL